MGYKTSFKKKKQFTYLSIMTVTPEKIYVYMFYAYVQ